MPAPHLGAGMLFVPAEAGRRPDRMHPDDQLPSRQPGPVQPVSERPFGDRPASIWAAIALGSNVGDREEHFRAAMRAINALDQTAIECVSTFHQTEPVGPPGQDVYLNAALTIRTGLSARRLLDELHRIEAARGRDRTKEVRWGPRTLDLDLLLYGDQIISERGLRVPHPRLHERLFVLAPLAEIAADRIIPGLNVSVAKALKAITPPGRA